MGIVAIVATLATAADLFKQIGKIKDTVWPPPPKELTEKTRWYQCTVKNGTQFRIFVKETYHNSGKFWTPPDAIDPFGTMTFSACNVDNGVGGATTGILFYLTLDDEHEFDFSVGITAPAVGHFKGGVVEATSAREGYERATQEGNHIVSTERYKAEDKDGKVQEIEFRVTVTPGKEMKVEIYQFIIKRSVS